MGCARIRISLVQVSLIQPSRRLSPVPLRARVVDPSGTCSGYAKTGRCVLRSIRLMLPPAGTGTTRSTVWYKERHGRVLRGSVPVCCWWACSVAHCPSDAAFPTSRLACRMHAMQAGPGNLQIRKPILKRRVYRANWRRMQLQQQRSFGRQALVSRRRRMEQASLPGSRHCSPDRART